MKIVRLLLFTALLAAPQVASSEWMLFEETTISSRISGSIRRGHIFETQSGNFYEVVDYVYLYEYEYRPDVIVLRDGDLYRLVIEGFDEPLLCRRLRPKQPPGTSMEPRRVNLLSQAALKALGFDPGPADGNIGEKSRAALRAFQVSAGLAVSGTPDTATLQSLAMALYARFPDEPAAIDVALELAAAAAAGEPGPPRQRGAACESGHWISDVSGSGEIIRLEDGSIWQVDSIDRLYTSLWLPVEEITVCQRTMINIDNGERVSVKRLR